MHLTDEQLNEYLDHESNERVQLELHLSTCEECSARLATLQNLFFEIESLPELELSQHIAARFTAAPTAKLPRALTLTMTLQAAVTVVTIIVATPFVTQFLSPYRISFSTPSPAEIFLQAQSQWRVWLDALSNFQLPALPEIPVADVSSVFILFTLICASLLWLVGNGLLLRNQMK